MKYFKFLALIFFVSIAFNIKIDKSLAAFGLDEKITQVKAENSPAIFYLDHKRGVKKAYVNETSFFAYGNKWSDVIAITKAQLDKWPDLKAVKVLNDPKIYYIKNGKKAYVESENDFNKLGLKWNEIATIKQEDLDQYSLSSYGELGLNMIENEYEIVKVKNRPAVYFVKNGNKTAIKSAADFEKLGFKWDDIIEVEKEDLENLEDIDYFKVGFEEKLNTPAVLNAALDPSSPKGGTNLPIGTNGNLLGIFRFTSQNGASLVTGLDFDFKGIFSDYILGELYLTDENKIQYNITPAKNGKNISFNFKNNPIIVGPSQPKKIYAWVDLQSCPDCPKVNMQVSLIKAVVEQSQPGVSGSFPIDANVFNLVDASSVLGQAEITENRLDNSDLEAVIGQAGQTVMSFNVKETSGNEDIYLNALKFEISGSLNSDYINNFVLKDKNKKVIARCADLKDKQLIFSIDNYKINRKSEMQFTIAADITDGDGASFDFKTLRSEITGVSNGYGAKTTISNISEPIKVIRKDVSILSKPLTASAKLFSKKKGSLLGVFEVRNSSEEIYLDSVSLNLIKSVNAPDLNKDVYLMNYDSGEILGQVSGRSFSANSADLRLGNSQLKAKAAFTIAVISELPKVDKSGVTYKIKINTLRYKTKSNQNIENKNPVEGNTFTALASKVFIYPNQSFSGIYAKGQKNVKIASFYAESSSDDSININSISIDKSGSEDLTYSNGFSNLKIYIGSKRIAVIEKPDRSVLTFNTSYKLSAGNRVEITLYADTAKDLKSDGLAIKLTGFVANSYTSGIESDVSGVNSISNQAIFYKVNVKIESISGGIISVNTKNNIVAAYKIKNESSENLSLKYITIGASGSGLSYGSGYSNLRLQNTTTSKKFGSTAAKPVIGANRIGMGYTLKPGEELSFAFYVDSASNTIRENFNVYVSKLEISGSKSNIEADVMGLPTSELNISVN